MAGAGLVFDVSRVHGLAEKVSSIADFDSAALLDGIGAMVAEQTTWRITNEKSAPDGTPWPVWSAAYAKTRHGNNSLLMGTPSDLKDSIQHIVNGTEVEVGTNLTYGAIHQFGGAEVGSNIPARPYLGLSAANVTRLTDEMNDFFEQHLQQVLA